MLSIHSLRSLSSFPPSLFHVFRNGNIKQSISSSALSSSPSSLSSFSSSPSPILLSLSSPFSRRKYSTLTSCSSLRIPYHYSRYKLSLHDTKNIPISHHAQSSRHQVKSLPNRRFSTSPSSSASPFLSGSIYDDSSPSSSSSSPTFTLPIIQSPSHLIELINASTSLPSLVNLLSHVEVTPMIDFTITHAAIKKMEILWRERKDQNISHENMNMSENNNLLFVDNQSPSLSSLSSPLIEKLFKHFLASLVSISTAIQHEISNPPTTPPTTSLSSSISLTLSSVLPDANQFEAACFDMLMSFHNIMIYNGYSAYTASPYNEQIELENHLRSSITSPQNISLSPSASSPPPPPSPRQSLHSRPLHHIFGLYKGPLRDFSDVPLYCPPIDHHRQHAYFAQYPQVLFEFSIELLDKIHIDKLNIVEKTALLHVLSSLFPIIIQIHNQLYCFTLSRLMGLLVSSIGSSALTLSHRWDVSPPISQSHRSEFESKLMSVLTLSLSQFFLYTNRIPMVAETLQHCEDIPLPIIDLDIDKAARKQYYLLDEGEGEGEEMEKGKGKKGKEGEIQRSGNEEGNNENDNKNIIDMVSVTSPVPIPAPLLQVDPYSPHQSPSSILLSHEHQRLKAKIGHGGNIIRKEVSDPDRFLTLLHEGIMKDLTLRWEQLEVVDDEEERNEEGDNDEEGDNSNDHDVSDKYGNELTLTNPSSNIMNFTPSAPRFTPLQRLRFSECLILLSTLITSYDLTCDLVNYSAEQQSRLFHFIDSFLPIQSLLPTSPSSSSPAAHPFSSLLPPDFISSYFFLLSRVYSRQVTTYTPEMDNMRSFMNRWKSQGLILDGHESEERGGRKKKSGEFSFRNLFRSNDKEDDGEDTKDEVMKSPLRSVLQWDDDMPFLPSPSLQSITDMVHSTATRLQNEVGEWRKLISEKSKKSQNSKNIYDSVSPSLPFSLSSLSSLSPLFHSIVFLRFSFFDIHCRQLQTKRRASWSGDNVDAVKIIRQHLLTPTVMAAIEGYKVVIERLAHEESRRNQNQDSHLSSLSILQQIPLSLLCDHLNSLRDIKRTISLFHYTEYVPSVLQLYTYISSVIHSHFTLSYRYPSLHPIPTSLRCHVLSSLVSSSLHDIPLLHRLFISPTPLPFTPSQLVEILYHYCIMGEGSLPEKFLENVMIPYVDEVCKGKGGTKGNHGEPRQNQEVFSPKLQGGEGNGEGDNVSDDSIPSPPPLLYSHPFTSLLSLYEIIQYAYSLLSFHSQWGSHSPSSSPSPFTLSVYSHVYDVLSTIHHREEQILSYEDVDQQTLSEMIEGISFLSSTIPPLPSPLPPQFPHPPSSLLDLKSKFSHLVDATTVASNAYSPLPLQIAVDIANPNYTFYRPRHSYIVEEYKVLQDDIIEEMTRFLGGKECQICHKSEFPNTFAIYSKKLGRITLEATEEMRSKVMFIVHFTDENGELVNIHSTPSLSTPIPPPSSPTLSTITLRGDYTIDIHRAINHYFTDLSSPLLPILTQRFNTANGHYPIVATIVISPSSYWMVEGVFAENRRGGVEGVSGNHKEVVLKVLKEKIKEMNMKGYGKWFTTAS